MNESDDGKKKRWFRVSQSTDSFRFVDVPAECRCSAREIGEELDDLQFLEMDDDPHWETTDIEEIKPEDIWHPAE